MLSEAHRREWGRRWSRKIESRFTPDYLLFHVRLNERVEATDGDKIHPAPEEIFQIERQPHEIPECRLPRRKLDQHIHIALGPLLSPGGGPEDANPRDAEPLPEQREHSFESRDEFAHLLPAHLDGHGYSPPDRTWGCGGVMYVVVRGSGLAALAYRVNEFQILFFFCNHLLEQPELPGNRYRWLVQ